MIKYKTVTTEVQELESITCNKCGESGTDLGFWEGTQEIIVQGGYSSKYLGDCSIYSFALCEKCLFELFQTFKINPFVQNTLDFGWTEDITKD